MIDELLVSYLNADATIASLAQEIAVGQVPVNDEGSPLVDTYIWISTYDEEDVLDLDGESGLTYYRFDIEVCSTDDRTAKRLGRRVKKILQGVGPGAFGEITVDNVAVVGQIDAAFIESKDENYIAVNQFTNDAISVVAYDLMIAADDSQDDFFGD